MSTSTKRAQLVVYITIYIYPDLQKEHNGWVYENGTIRVLVLQININKL